MKKTELKPCPFCGETPIYAVAPDGENDSIDCRCGESECFLNDERFSQWNHRPIEDEQAARIAELETQVDGLQGALAQSDGIAERMRVEKLEAALREILECEVITDCGDFSKGETGFDCKEVKEIIRKALEDGE